MATLPKSPASISSIKLPHIKMAGKPSLHGSRTLSISEAKTHLLSVVDNLQKEGGPITITRRGKPIAQIIPFAPVKRVSGYGCMKGTATITGDIVGPEHDAWESGY